MATVSGQLVFILWVGEAKGSFGVFGSVPHWAGSCSGFPGLHFLLHVPALFLGLLLLCPSVPCVLNGIVNPHGRAEER